MSFQTLDCLPPVALLSLIHIYTDAEIARLQGAIEKFVNDTNAMADRMEKTVGAKDADILRGHIDVYKRQGWNGTCQSVHTC